MRRRAAAPCDRGRRRLVSLRTGRADSFGRSADIGIPEIALLALLGVVVGTYGTLVGVGGGFLVVPLLLLIYKLPHDQAAATSLVVVLLNAASGSVSYFRRRRVDVRTGLVLAAGTIPGALVGPWLGERIPDRAFRLVFALFLFALGAFLFLRPERTAARRSATRAGFGRVHRRFAGPDGESFDYSYSLPLAIGISLLVGVLSSLLGIGGGIVHVPAMIHLMDFPIHIATATSQFVLAITALTGVAEYARRGDVVWPIALAIGAGVIGGAQIGAAISQRMRGRGIVRLLSAAVLVLAGRLLWSVMH